MKTAPCAGCRAPLYWRYTPKGQLMPLDARPTDESGQGVYVIEDDTTCRPYEPMFDPEDTERHMNHWTTCPSARQFRMDGKKE